MHGYKMTDQTAELEKSHDPRVGFTRFSLLFSLPIWTVIFQSCISVASENILGCGMELEPPQFAAAL